MHVRALRPPSLDRAGWQDACQLPLLPVGLLESASPRAQERTTNARGVNSMDADRPSPEHMDRWTRNKRLYGYLRDLGLFVIPIYSDGECPGIEYMHVATAMPEAPLLPVEGSRKKRGT